MRIAVLYIISAFIFSACAAREPVMTARDFNEYKNRMNEFLADHSRRHFHMDDSLKDVYHGCREDLNKVIQQFSTALNDLNASFEDNRARMDKVLHLLFDSLARKGIKIDLNKEGELQQKEAVKRKLKEEKK